jgi:hypothetical protein
MEIVGIILLIVISIVLSYVNKCFTGDWISAYFCSLVVIFITMLATMLLTANKCHEEVVKEYLQHPERYSIKVIYEDSIPVDTIVELK